MLTRALLVTTLLVACTPKAPVERPAPSSATEVATAPTAPAAPAAVDETGRLNAFFMGVYWRTVRRSPMIQAYLGLNFDKDKWDDLSDAHQREDMELAKGDLDKLRSTFNFDALDEQGKLSYQLFERRLVESIEDFEWRFHSYPVNQMFGMHSQVPAFLGNFHNIGNVEDAEAYISRLQSLPTMFAQLEEALVTRENMGILPPKFVFPMAIEDGRNIISGAPFDESGTDNPIWADFRTKLGKLTLDDAERARLEAAARAALVDRVAPAYQSLLRLLERQQGIATTDDGAWKLPSGAEFYERELAKTTTTAMTADEIHDLGLREVERIHGEMRNIMKKVGFKGSLGEFFEFMRTDSQFYYPNTDEGRAAYLAKATSIVDSMRARLDELFITKPKAAMVVKRVEPYREKSAGLAFYNPPSLDGSRAGIYYVNLYDMAVLSKYEMEALAFHEGIPGHHMQNAIAMERDDLPMFRRFLGYTAYGEGWGLYTERLAKELGFYQDPYSDFGRLSMELWRACRLVIDTGVHYKRWTRERAIAWLSENTPGSERDVRKAVERYIVMPSQATAYTIGMLEILRLRKEAQQQLGDQFDIREFHEVVLTNGPLPLNVLEQQVQAWVARKLG